MPPSSPPPRRSSPSLASFPHSTFRFAHPLWYLVIFFGLFTLYLCAAYPKAMPSPFTALQPLHDVAYAIFRTQLMLQIAFAAALAGHAGEAVYAYSVLLDRKGVAGNDRVYWTVQTLLLGFPSLRLLRALPDARRE